jgi:hypothetical protein
MFAGVRAGEWWWYSNSGCLSVTMLTGIGASFLTMLPPELDLPK